MSLIVYKLGIYFIVGKKVFRWCTALQQKQWIMTLAGQYKDNKNESYCVTCSHLLSYHVWWNTRLLSLLWTLGPWNLKLLEELLYQLIYQPDNILEVKIMLEKLV